MHYSLMSCIRTGDFNVIIGPSYGTSIAEDKLSENKLYSRLIKTIIRLLICHTIVVAKHLKNH